jgi:hypothetical protein
MGGKVMRRVLDNISYWKVVLIISVLFICFQSTSYAAQNVTLQWDANTESDLDHYVIYWGTSERPPYANTSGDINKNTTTYTVTGLDLDQCVYYFAAKAFDTEGLESDWSNIVSPSGSETPIQPPASSSGNGCFIVTAAYGSKTDRHVQILTEFRDRHLVTNSIGRGIVDTYYKFSPPVAKYLHKHPFARAAVRYALVPVTGIAYISLSIHPLALLFAFVILITTLVYYFKRLASRSQRSAM